ncbi:hypothetical protein [Hymenobacter glaciei]
MAYTCEYFLKKAGFPHAAVRVCSSVSDLSGLLDLALVALHAKA